MSAERVIFSNTRGEELVGILHGGRGDTAVISCHGMLSNKDGSKHQMLADDLDHRGVACLRFDFAGHGESQGSLFDLSLSGRIADLQAAIEYLVKRGIKRFGLFGSSLGGAVALLTAARDERVVAIATLAAVGHPAQLIERNAAAMHGFETQGYVETEDGRIGRNFLDDAREHNLIAAVRVLHAPLLVIHGEEDDVVPSSDGHDIATTARNASLEMIAGVGHRFEEPGLLRPIVRQVVEFFLTNLGL